MLNDIKSWLGKEPETRRSLPPGQRYYAIGDIHGRADLLAEMHRLISVQESEAEGGTATIVYLGDYVDRGLESRAVIDLLMAGLGSEYAHIYLRGNHDDLFERFLEGDDIGPLWFRNGGTATAFSYGIQVAPSAAVPVDWDSLRAELRAAVPANHKRFLSRLELSHRAGDYLFVHAGIRPGVALEAQDPSDLMWIREPFLSARRGVPVTVVHGHTPAHAAEVARHRIGVDTAAYATNRLTCVKLEGDSHGFIVAELP